MNSVTSVYFNNSPYTIQTTGIKGTSVSFQIDQKMIGIFEHVSTETTNKKELKRKSEK